MNLRGWKLKRTFEPLKHALESHHRSLEELESALRGFEETFLGREERPERPQAQQGEAAGGGGHLDLLSSMEVCQELRIGKS